MVSVLYNHLYLVLQHFHHFKIKPSAIKQSLRIAPPRCQSEICLHGFAYSILFHTNGITLYAAFCDGLLSLSTMFLRFIRIAA